MTGNTNSQLKKLKEEKETILRELNGDEDEEEKKEDNVMSGGGKLKLGKYVYYGQIKNGKANGYGELYQADKKTLVHRGHFKNNEIL